MPSEVPEHRIPLDAAPEAHPGYGREDDRSLLGDRRDVGDEERVPRSRSPGSQAPLRVGEGGGARSGRDGLSPRGSPDRAWDGAQDIPPGRGPEGRLRPERRGNTMKKLGPEDLLDIAAYEKVREQRLDSVIRLKKHRRVAVGPLVTFVFENRETIRSQVQEMMRAERLVQD